jgi:tRNA1Val (adenine37-N6)-methyltransferase
VKGWYDRDLSSIVGFMSIDEFHFRDFSMRQAPSGQRVNTDSCVFGALIGRDARPERALDIGSGTGVLSLMLASRDSNVLITAVEPELEIAEVAKQNFAASPWHERIDLLTLRAQDLNPDIHGQFDFVFCNPPYFQNSMISDDRLRTVARHNTSLSPGGLYQSMTPMMSDNGTAWVSFPGDSTRLWMEPGRGAGLHPLRCITVKDHPDATAHMIVVGWSKQRPEAIAEETVCYRESRNGKMSPWMIAFREEWYPARYNEQFK